MYSLTSALPALVAFTYLYNTFYTLEYVYISNNLFTLSQAEKMLICAAFVIVFAVKIPLFPFHSWLLNAHVEAPTGGSIVLAAVLLKLGLFGMIRLPLGLFLEQSITLRPAIIFIALCGVVYSAVLSLKETDAKRLIALTSIGHMGIGIIGLFSFTNFGFFGAIYLAVGHAVTATALFFLIGILYDRFHTRDITALGGLVSIMPLYSTALFFFLMANTGFPCSLSFLGEAFVI